MMKASGARHTVALDAERLAAAPPAPPVVSGFSLVVGGPFYRSLQRLKLVGTLPSLGERTLVFLVVAWVPLLVLAAMDGTAEGHRVTIPLLSDFAVYGRFWVALPLLVIADVVIDPWLRRTVVTLEQSGIIGADDRPAYHAALERIVRLRDSAPAELLLFLLAFLPVFLVTGGEWGPSMPTTWYDAPGGGPSAAGWWFALVSSPLLRFLWLRWLWRAVGLWGLLLYRVTRLPLHLMPTHPDKLGGLGFVLVAERRLGILCAALGAVIAGQYGNWIVYLGARVTDLEVPMLVFIGCSFLVVLCPLLSFSTQLAVTRREGLIRYSKVGRELTKAFDAKWVAGGRQRPGGALLEDQAPSALIDYISSYESISRMRVLPMNRDLILASALQAAAPLAVVWLLATPLDRIVAQLLRMLI